MTPSLPAVILVVIKIFFIIAISLYDIFAGILVRQEQLMAHVLEESFEPILRIAVLVHFVISIGLLALAFLLL